MESSEGPLAAPVTTSADLPSQEVAPLAPAAMVAGEIPASETSAGAAEAAPETATTGAEVGPDGAPRRRRRRRGGRRHRARRERAAQAANGEGAATAPADEAAEDGEEGAEGSDAPESGEAPEASSTAVTAETPAAAASSNPEAAASPAPGTAEATGTGQRKRRRRRSRNRDRRGGGGGAPSQGGGGGYAGDRRARFSPDAPDHVRPEVVGGDDDTFGGPTDLDEMPDDDLPFVDGAASALPPVSDDDEHHAAPLGEVPDGLPVVGQPPRPPRDGRPPHRHPRPERRERHHGERRPAAPAPVVATDGALVDGDASVAHLADGTAPVPPATPATPSRHEGRPAQPRREVYGHRHAQGERAPHREHSRRDGRQGDRRRQFADDEAAASEAPTRTRPPEADFNDEPPPPALLPEVTLADIPEATREGPFGELGLAPAILKAIAEAGYVSPTSIQSQAIPVLIEGRDLIGASQTGTGKTAAFALPTLHRLATSERGAGVRCLVLEPTRELAQQVYEHFQRLSKFLNLRLALLYGGVGYGEQRAQLRARPDVVIATPGRLLDHVGQRAVNLSTVQTLILDEADRMLDMGFMPDVRRIIKECPRDRQSLLFSATIPPAIKDLAEWMLRNPAEINVAGGTRTADTITHAIYPVDPRQKFDLLSRILEKTEYHSCIIFSRTKMGADVICRWLQEHGHEKVGVLHADRQQKERTQTMTDFKEGKIEVLVATDIVARGIDIAGISHIINYDIPQHPEDYVHRIGRTGRMHNTGDAFTLMTADEMNFLNAIEKLIGKPIPRAKLDGFDYLWTPLLEEKKPVVKKRNRGYTPPPASFGQ